MGFWDTLSSWGQDAWDAVPTSEEVWGPSSSAKPQDPIGDLFSQQKAISSPGEKLGGSSGGWDSNFLNSALNSAVSLGSQLWADKSAQKNAKEDRRLAAQELALKAKYGLLGGGGGGGGAGTSNLINAYKSAADMTNQSAQLKGQALERLIAASTRPLLR